jgi:Fe-S-cluster containining protein
MNEKEIMDLKCTEGLAGIVMNMQQMYGDKECMLFLEKVNDYIKAFSKQTKPKILQKPIETIIEINELLDSRIEKEKIVEVNCDKCKTADCCFINVDITLPEALLIMKYIYTKTTLPLFLGEEAWKRLNIQADFMDKLPVGENSAQEYNKIPEHTKCAFLDNNNKCMIYSVRPLRCRAYFVLNNKCNKAKFGDRVPRWCSVEGEIILSAMITFTEDYHMSNILIKLYNDSIK